ncbi:hypothetical protein ASPBRDRAFT_127674 [Aspergillus brasiliensis CBS 101740]|uniref:Zn(2)-C6 fungal-type domain-containing protein n=1 Tax=Aspergillus brasiliensis (strain CBS 101740 / IMI 381727 / IBT 21946) TaxID=767769 RepID=A0A1L9UGL1_ASPBC|nr:hypothetical protein ASPBRDRAFT_127674 [Aspergillus brasiliensis CBS 101740]
MQQSAALPKRLSCDRCYGQKLRCPRPSTSDDPSCIRCLRQKVQCVYSTALPKGRPRAAARAGAGAAAGPGATTSIATTTTTASSISDTVPSIFSAEDLASFPGLSTSAWPPDATWEDNFSFPSPHVVPQPPPLDPTPPPSSSSAPNSEYPEICIRQLSDLATRLHAVYQTTRALSDHPLITNAAFEAVTTLFDAPSSPPSATNSTTTNLRETFTSSHYLLETISHLLWTSPSNNPSPAPALAADDTVIYHFTIACYTLLLLIYATLLTALHRDALTHAQPSLSTTTSTTGHDNTSTWCSSPSLVQLRLVLLFHVISYFLDRLQQMVRMYTAEFEKQPTSSTTTTTGRRLPASGRWSEEVEEQMMVEDPWEQYIPPPPPPTSPSSSLGSISELETRARSALMQLRLSLVAAPGGFINI